MHKLLIVLFVLSLYACNGRVSNTKSVSAKGIDTEGYQYKSKVTHAKGFSIELKEDYKEITVYNPWDNDKVLRKYALISRDQTIPQNLPNNIILIKVPVQSAAIFSNTHVGPIVKLGLEDKVVGLTRAGKVYNKDLFKRVQSGAIVNLGGAHNKNIDIETIVELNPELIILSAFNEVKAGEVQLEDVGLKLAYSINWMEATPLGRAEWMKFVAAFFNKEALADSIFSNIENNYNNLKQLAAKANSKPYVLLGWSYKGIWYVPGGNNYMVSYLRDAGANYFLFDDDTRGNIPMSVESVLDQCNHADVWIYPGNCRSLDDIENSGEIFTQFDAFRKAEVYNIYKRSNPNGGSDWWEMGSVNPDKALKDFIQILHPELFSKDSTYFFSKLDYLKK